MKKYKNSTSKFVNDDKMYEDHFERRGVEDIEQNNTPVFNKEILNTELQVVDHVWSRGDKFYKLAHDYYGDTKYWWVIATWNGTPTEAHCFYGKIIEIPYPVEQLYRGLV
tara:strand:- start:515 stop:844 length:330 start_codon:yes stop_codon:yes gene_type:complete